MGHVIGVGLKGIDGVKGVLSGINKVYQSVEKVATDNPLNAIASSGLF